MYKSIYIKRGKEESLLRFHPWVFSGAILRMDEGIEEGDFVRVLAENGGFIAVGHYQIGSISVRVLSFRDIQIDEEFWTNRLASALKMRISIGIADNAQNNTYRLVHGEGDNLPGLVIDCYGKTAVMQAHSVGIHVCRKDIAVALMKVMGSRIENVFYKSETTLPFTIQPWKTALNSMWTGFADKRRDSLWTSVRTALCLSNMLVAKGCSICSAILVVSLSMLCAVGPN